MGLPMCTKDRSFLSHGGKGIELLRCPCSCSALCERGLSEALRRFKNFDKVNGRGDTRTKTAKVEN